VYVNTAGKGLAHFYCGCNPNKSPQFSVTFQNQPKKKRHRVVPFHYRFSYLFKVAAIRFKSRLL